MNKYKNLWVDGHYIKGPEYYENNARMVGSHRGVEVFKLGDMSFDYVVGGACITQRAGFNKKSFSILVDGLLDGVGECCGNKVAAHLRSLGFTPKTHDEACAEYELINGGVK